MAVVCLVTAGRFTGGALLAADPPRYTAELIDGSRVSEREVRNWSRDQRDATLGNAHLFDRNKPARWLHNNLIRLDEPPQARVELIGGDVLPGEVVELTSADQGLHAVPQHLLVRLQMPLAPTSPYRVHQVRVLPQYVRRIVWEPTRREGWQPGTAFFRDGSQVSFRTWRMRGSMVRLLLESGTREVSSLELAELHLPAIDPWEAHFASLAALAPNEEDRLLQLTTADGLVLTTSQQRMYTVAGGGVNDWVQQIQPAWALDPILVQFSAIERWRMFALNELPLSRLAPAESVVRSPLGVTWRWRRDQSVQQSPLSGDELAPTSGFGVHAYTELAFPLCDAARRFRTGVGLDRSVGRGGCAVARVYAGPANQTSSLPEKPLYTSPTLIGFKASHDSNWLTLPKVKPDETARLWLVADPLPEDRPKGSDPLDIRDHVNWLEPLLELDQAAVKAEIRRLRPQLPAAWDGWTVAPQEGVLVEYQRTRDDHGRELAFRPMAQLPKGKLTFRRTIEVRPTASWLAVHAYRDTIRKDSDPQLEVRLAGQSVARWRVPRRDSREEARPQLVPVVPWRGQSLEVEIIAHHDTDSGWIDWQGITLLDDYPGRATLVEERNEGTARLEGVAGLYRWSSESPWSGAESLVVRGGEEPTVELTGLSYQVSEHPVLGEYRYLRFACREPVPAGFCVEVHAEGPVPIGSDAPGEELVFRYQFSGTAEKGVKTLNMDQGWAPRVNDWRIATVRPARDLGDARITRIVLRTPKGEQATVDHFLLARQERDFEQLDNVSSQIDGFDAFRGDFAPGFRANGSGVGGFARVLEHGGRYHVVRTHPMSKDSPAKFRREVEVAKSGRTELVTSFSYKRQIGADWELRVIVDGELIHETPVGRETFPSGWGEVCVDLTPWAGRKIMLEVHNAASDWQDEFAYWDRIDVIHHPAGQASESP